MPPRIWNMKAFGARVSYPAFHRKKLCTNCEIDNRAEFLSYDRSLDNCDTCGTRIRGDETLSKDIIHYTSNRVRIFKFLKKAAPISGKKAMFRDFPVGLFNKIKHGFKGKMTRRGGTAFQQQQVTLVNAEQIGEFFKIDGPIQNSLKLVCAPQAVALPRGTIKVIAPPVTLKHTTKYDGTESMECQLIVTYNVVVVQRNGNIRRSNDFPLDRKKWGWTKDFFEPTLELEMSVIGPAVVVASKANLACLPALQKVERRIARKYRRAHRDPDQTYEVRLRQWEVSQLPSLRILRNTVIAEGGQLPPYDFDAPRPVPSSSDSEEDSAKVSTEDSGRETAEDSSDDSEESSEGSEEDTVFRNIS